MADKREKGGESGASWRARMDLNMILAISAFLLSGFGFYRSYYYKSNELAVTATELSYVTNAGGLYMTVAFSNGGNRDAALLRVEPALWGRRADKAQPAWIPLIRKVHADVPITSPKMPTVVKAGGVEIVTLSAVLNPADAEQAVVNEQGGAFIGIRVATMNSDGNLYLLQHPVARLVIDRSGKIRGAEPAIHQSLSGFINLDGPPPGDMLKSNEKTPFVWADEQS